MLETARLLSVNVGLPREITWRGQTVRTAVWKNPVHGKRMVRRLNIDGDAHCRSHVKYSRPRREDEPGVCFDTPGHLNVATADETRHSLGTRQFGGWKGWDWNAEEVLQVGSFGNKSIRAWTASLDTGYTFQAPLQPRLGVNADIASGNRHPNGGTQGTFNTLFFMSGYFNDASLFRPQNIIDVHPLLGLQLTRTLSMEGGGDVFWRYSRNGAIYNPPGFILIPALNTASSYLGTAADINFTWQIQRHVSLGASYVHFFTASYIHQAGGSDMNFVSTTLSFLF
jgi:Alginate export